MPAMYSLYASYLVQIIGTAFLAVLLARFYRVYGHSYLREWSWSWAALSVYVSGGLAAILWSRAYAPDHPLRLLVAMATLIGGYTQVACLLFGTYSVARGHPVEPRRRRLFLGACIVVGVVFALLFTRDAAAAEARFFVRIGIRSLAAGVAYLAAGIWLGRMGGWRRGVGRAIVVAAFFLYGAEQLNYFAFNLIEFLGLGSAGPELALLGFLDLLLQFAMGLGMVIWLLEEERDELERTADALHRSEERLRQSQRLEAVGRLAGGIAHDFNNLLTIITGRGQRLLPRLPRGSEEREEARQIDEAAQRGADLVRQLLAFSRRQVLAPTHVQANQAVRNVAGMLQRSLGEHVSFECKLDPDLGWALVDPSQLEQVLVNLALNARDAMPDGGVLTMSTQNLHVSADRADSLAGLAPGDHVEVAVRDTGMGMDDDVRRKIFDPFYTTKEIGRGSGLGLAMVYGIVRQSGGVVQVDSAPDEGTEVRVIFPRVPSPSVDEACKPERASAARADRVEEAEIGHTVLVVEDDERIRGMLGAVLRDNGYEVIVARDGVEALDIARKGEQQIDLLLTDVVMPGLGGPELAERLSEENVDLNVLFMSGYSEEIVSSRMPGPSAALLEKPFSLPDLLERVRQSLGP